MNGKIRWLVEKKTAYILFVPLFSYFILSKELYRHHLLSLTLGLIGVISMNGCIFPLCFSICKDYIILFIY